MSAHFKVLLLGAGGTLGGYIAELICDHRPDIELIVAMRHPPKAGSSLAEYEYRYLDLNIPDSYEKALNDIDVLVHAAGPFNHSPEPLLNACFATETHYVDIAEDLHFLTQVHRIAQNERPKRTCVFPGCSTVPALVSLLTQTFARIEDMASIHVYLNMGSRNPVSYGLLRGLLQPLQQGYFRSLHDYHYRDGVKRTHGNYPLPLAEGFTVDQRVIPGCFFAGFDRRYINVMLSLAGRIIPSCSSSQLNTLTRAVLPVVGLLRLLGGKEGRLIVEARDEKRRALACWQLTAEDRGLYLPAAPSLWAVDALEKLGQAAPSGLIELSDLISVDDVVGWIQQQGYKIEFFE